MTNHEKESRKTQIIQLIKDAAQRQTAPPSPVDPPAQPSVSPDEPRSFPHRLLLILLVIALGATMLQSHLVVTVASFTALALGLVGWFVTRGSSRQVFREARFMVAMLAALSITSGCGPILKGPSTDLQQLCSQELSCKEGRVRGFYVFGLPVKHVTVADAKAVAGIQEVTAVDRLEGFGLFAVTEIVVYGE